MSHDEQRKRIFELECALGKAIKVAEQSNDSHKITSKRLQIMCDVNELIIDHLKLFIKTNDKMYLLKAIEKGHESVLNLREISPVK